MALQLRGFAFPFRIDPATGGVAAAEDHDKIRQNVRVLLRTAVGERPMLPAYGTPLATLVQEPNDAALAEVALTQSQQALLRWEPRVIVTGTQVFQQEGELHLRLDYVLSSLTAARSSLSLPIR